MNSKNSNQDSKIQMLSTAQVRQEINGVPENEEVPVENNVNTPEPNLNQFITQKGPTPDSPNQNEIVNSNVILINSDKIQSKKQSPINTPPFGSHNGSLYVANAQGNKEGAVIEDKQYIVNANIHFPTDECETEVQKKKKRRKKKHDMILTARQIKRILRAKPINYQRIYFQIYYFMVALVVLCLSIVAFRDQQLSQDLFDQLVNNWQSEPISDIQFTSTSYNCSEIGEQYTPLFKYNWPGSYTGCDCSINSNISSGSSWTVNSTQSFFREYFQIDRICNKSEIAKSCTSVEEQVQYYWSTFSDGNFGKPFTLCAKRISGANYVHNGGQDDCDEDQIKCGTGPKYFCVPNNSSCPITQMGFTTNANYSGIAQINKTSYGSILNLGHKFYFYYLKNTTSNPIAEVVINEGYGVCALNKQQNISPERIDYPLLKVQRTPCEYTDPMFTLLHSIQEEQVYLANNQIYLSTTLPYFYVDNSYNWSMFAKPYTSWADDCKYLQSDLVNAGKTMGWVFTSLKVQLGITIAYFLIVGLLCNVVGVMTALNFAWSCMTTKAESQFNIVFVTELTIKMVLQVAEIIIICVCFAIIQIRNHIVHQAQDCTDDPIIQPFLHNLDSDMVKYLWNYNLANLVIFIVTFFVDFYIIRTSIKSGEHEGGKVHKHKSLMHHHHSKSKSKKEQNDDPKLTVGDQQA